MKFGDYIKTNRIKKKLSLAKTAKMLGISLSYLSSLESGARHAPPFFVQQKMSDILELNENERFQLYDLAAESKQPPTLAEDLNEYIYKNPVIRDMLRYSMKCQLTGKEWEITFAYIKRNYHY